ncbi:MAG: hypothetical protein ACOC2H_06560 [Spirochaetota bacterium]
MFRSFNRCILIVLLSVPLHAAEIEYRSIASLDSVKAAAAEDVINPDGHSRITGRISLVGSGPGVRPVLTTFDGRLLYLELDDAGCEAAIAHQYRYAQMTGTVRTIRLLLADSTESSPDLLLKPATIILYVIP